MPSRRAASKASRSVTTKVAPMGLLGDNDALGGLLVILAHERVPPGLERAHPDLQGLAGGNDLLDAQLLALELLSRAILVGDHEHERSPRLHLDLLGLEAVLLDDEGDL